MSCVRGGVPTAWCCPSTASRSRRVLQGALEALSHIPEHHSGWQCWSERVFITIDGVERSLHSMWKSAPWWLNTTVAVTRLLGSRSLRPFFELTRADGYRALDADFSGEPMRDAVVLETSGSPAVV
jgi:hypothetical protein